MRGSALVLIFISVHLSVVVGPAANSAQKFVEFKKQKYPVVEKVGGADIILNGRKFLFKEIPKSSRNLSDQNLNTIASADNVYVAKNDYEEKNGKLKMIIDYFPAGNLRNLLSYTNGKLSGGSIKFFVVEMVAAIDYMHQKMGKNGHLQPDQDFYLGNDGHIVMSPLAFGHIHKHTNPEYPKYMAPEVLYKEIDSHFTSFTEAADWWSMGAFIYEAITGDPPYSLNDLKRFSTNNWKFDPLHFPTNCDVALTALLVHLLKSKPEERLGNSKDKSVKGHDYFKGVNWVAVHAKRLSAPYLPRISVDDTLTGIDERKELEKPAAVVKKDPNAMDLDPVIDPNAMDLDFVEKVDTDVQMKDV